MDTLIRYDAIRIADSLNDQLNAATIAALKTNAVSQQDFQEGILSQLKRVLFGDDAGSWDEDFASSGVRPLKQVDAGVKAVDKVIIRPRRTQVQANIAVPTSQNWVVLSAGNGQVPTPPISLAPTTQGAVAAILGAGQIGTNQTIAPIEAGINILLDIVDAATEQQINDLTKTQPIRGILQVTNTASDGSPFDDGADQAQISFVTTNPTTFQLVPADIASISGKTIHYAFAQRQQLSTIPTVGFLIDGVGFVDGAAAVDVTRQNAYQFGPLATVAVGRPHQTDLGDSGSEVAWRIKGVNVLHLVRDDSVAGNLLEATVDRFNLNNTQTATVQKGLRADAADGGIDIGVTVGKIARLAGSLAIEATGGTLTLNGLGGELALSDSRLSSPIFFSSPGSAAFLGELAGQPSLLAAINKAATVGGTRLRLGIKQQTGTTINAGSNWAGGGFFDFTTAGLVFYDETNVTSTRNALIFLNGVLLRNGDATNPHDVRLGASPSAGDLIFNTRVRTGDVITVCSLILA